MYFISYHGIFIYFSMKKNKLPVLSSSTSSITNTSCMHTFINDTSDPRISKYKQSILYLEYYSSMAGNRSLKKIRISV